jgi:2-polyprenyl-3-methyl-5-hydroxy-6-metoxy-1,4-benzoquinol methylase
MTAPVHNESEMAKLDRISQEYQKPDAGRRVDQKLISLLVGRAIPWMTGPEIIEMGSGDDQWTQRLIEHFGHSHLVDGSRTLIEAARKKYGAKLTTYHSLFEELDPGKQFDTVLSSLVLEHVEDPVKVLATAAGWLKPQGHLIVIVPNALSLHRRLAVAMGLTRAADELGESDVRLGHRWVFTIPSMEAHLAKAGLQIVRQAGWLTKPLPQGMMTDFSDALLEGLMKLGDELPMEHACFLAFECRKAR